MKISVIIPTLNEEHYLPKALKSLKRLYRQPDEIIVVDSSSKDKTRLIAKKFGTKVIKTHLRGIGLARDLGLQKAKGDIVAFTDADTSVPRDWLNKIEGELSKPGVVGVYGSFQVPNGWWVYKYYVNYIQPTVNQFYHLLGITMAPGQNIAFRRRVGLAVGGFPENFKFAEDVEMARRLSEKGKVLYIKDHMVLSSGRRGKEGMKMLIRVFKSFMNYFLFRKGDSGFPAIR